MDQDDERRAPRVARRGQVRRYLIVANLTLGGEHLLTKLRECMAAGPCRFRVVVPATPDPRPLTWTEEGTRRAARRRLEQALARFSALGAEVTGEVGDGMPLLAIGDALRAEPCDEIIISTLPHGASRWLKLDLPHRVSRNFGLPVSHVVAALDAPIPTEASPIINVVPDGRAAGGVVAGESQPVEPVGQEA
jgi:hypothetical protein